MLRVMITACLLVAACCAQAAEKVKPMVGVYYFPGWYRTGGEKGVAPYDRATDWSEWRGAIAKAAVPRPVCGFYDDSNPAVWSYFDRWISSHGIDFIAFDWYYNDGEEYLSESLDKGFLGCKASGGIKFCLNWCNHGGYWWHSKLDQTIPKLEKMIDLACDEYFNRPNYLRIDGKPVFMIYETDILSSFCDVKTALAAIRNRAKQRGCPELYLVGVYSGADRSRNRSAQDLRLRCLLRLYLRLDARPQGDLGLARPTTTPTSPTTSSATSTPTSRASPRPTALPIGRPRSPAGTTARARV